MSLSMIEGNKITRDLFWAYFQYQVSTGNYSVYLLRSFGIPFLDIGINPQSNKESFFKFKISLSEVQLLYFAW